MKIKEINHLPIAISLSPQFPSEFGWMFRGQTDESWELIPAAGRSPHLKKSTHTNDFKPAGKDNPPPDLGMFNTWRQLAEGCKEKLPENDFRCLAVAQHYCLPTRLLDFSENILTALYFACEGNFDRDGALYAYHPESMIKIRECDLYNVPRKAALRVPPFDQRILLQRGVFVYFPDPSDPIRPLKIDDEFRQRLKQFECGDYDLVKFVIPRKSKLLIIKHLRNVGISRRSLFPDLDGLSRDFVEQDYENFHFQKQKSKQESS